MRILVAADSFKGTLTAAQASAAIARGFRQALPDAEVDELPLADGGEGTMDVLLRARGGRRVATAAHGPLGDALTAEFGLLDGGSTAVVEMAEASGLLRVEAHRRDVLRASTFGTGELIAAALDREIHELLIGLGGSATCDGGAGGLQALGVRLIDAQGRTLAPHAGGGMLRQVARIEPGGLLPRWRDVRVSVLCDVSNPLLGPRGAAAVYAPQKGATPEQVRLLEIGLSHWAELLKRDLGADVKAIRHGGAAGGLAAGLAAIGATPRSGAEAILEQVDFAAGAARADAVVTGEGRLDEQSLSGKLISAVAEASRRLSKPVFVIAGQVRLACEHIQARFAGVAAVEGHEQVEPSAAVAEQRLEQTAAECAALWWPSSRCG